MLLTETGAVPVAVAAALDRLHPGGALGLAVSGGGDSVALMRAAAPWAASRGVRLAVATVDHGLRPESAWEAAAVVADAAALGLPAAALRWQGRKPQANLQDAARRARSRLLAGWAAREGLAAVALGHTLDDQAETVLLRLARGSGVDGLSGMTEAARRDGALWLRPLLGLRRAALRDWLAAQGVGWIDDPSNDDPRFERAKARHALAALASLGIDAVGLAETAARMARARRALDAATAALAARAAVVGLCGDVVLDLAALGTAEEEIALRLLSATLRGAAGAEHRPRFDALTRLWRAARAPDFRGATLHGCVVGRRGGALRIAREPAACAARALDGHLWDGRWIVAATAPGAVGPLGEGGLAALRAAQAAGAWAPPVLWAGSPRPARLSTPALWRDGRLAAAPVAGYGAGLTASLGVAPPGARVETGRPALM